MIDVGVEEKRVTLLNRILDCGITSELLIDYEASDVVCDAG